MVENFIQMHAEKKYKQVQQVCACVGMQKEKKRASIR